MQPSFHGAARVMVPGGRKRRDSASVGAQVSGVRRPGNEGSGELAAGWESGHNRRRWAGKEPRKQPSTVDLSLAGTGSRGCWFPREGGTGRTAGPQAVGGLSCRALRPDGGVVVQCLVGRGPAVPHSLFPGQQRGGVGPPAEAPAGYRLADGLALWFPPFLPRRR